MGILKGSFLGWWLFAFGTLGFLCLTAFRNLRLNTAVGLSVITGQTAQNPLWWATLVVLTVASCLVTRSWPGQRSCFPQGHWG